MSQILDGMIAVAAGDSSTVKRWSEALRKRKIPFAIAQCSYTDSSVPGDRAEIWVEKSDAEKARIVIRNGKGEDKSLIW